MISVQLDASGAYRVRWPRKDQGIIALGQLYVAHEGAAPPEQRVAAPTLTLVQAALVEAQAGRAAAMTGEVARATASETYRQTLAEAKDKLNMAIVRLKSQYLSNLAQLEAWGLETVIGANGISVRKPRSDSAWADFLQTYTTQESSLPLEEQISDPPLAEITALAATLEASGTARFEGKNQREAGVQKRSLAGQKLLDLIQLAGMVLVATRFDRQVTNDLQAWGFDVVARNGSSASPPPEEPEEPAA